MIQIILFILSNNPLYIFLLFPSIVLILIDNDAIIVIAGYFCIYLLNFDFVYFCICFFGKGKHLNEKVI